MNTIIMNPLFFLTSSFITSIEDAIGKYESPQGAGILQMELAKYYFVRHLDNHHNHRNHFQFLNNIPRSTTALKEALKDNVAKPAAVRMMAELSELREGQEAALEMFQYVVDTDGSDSQTWVVGS